MRNTIVFEYLRRILGILSVIFAFTLAILPQTSELEKPKIKDFGKSLRTKNPEDKAKNGKENEEEKDVIKIETNLVISDFLVIDPKGNAVLGLNADDFLITENDVPQEISTFSLGDSVAIPRSIVLIIDTSCSQTTFLETSVAAAKVLVDKLNPQDRMAIVTDDVAIWSHFTKDKALMKKGLSTLISKYALAPNTERIRSGIAEQTQSGIVRPFPNKQTQQFPTNQIQQFPKGLSKQYSALMATLNELFDEEDIRPIVIFQTDGDEYFHLKSQEPGLAGESVFSFQEMYNKIEKSRATVFSIVSGMSIFDLPSDERLKKLRNERLPLINAATGKRLELNSYVEKVFAEQDSMARIAKASGGFTQGLEKPEQADEIYSRILSSITKRYLVGFNPKNEEKDGNRREVKVKVRGHPEYSVLGRKYYYAPSPR